MKTLSLIGFALRKRIDYLDARVIGTDDNRLMKKYRRIRRRIVKRWRFITGPLPPQM